MVCHSLAGVLAGLGIRGSQKACRKGKAGERKKRLSFGTSEATILLKTKDGYCKKGQKQTDLQAQISPEMHPKNAIFANS
jgi:hypothetical protein